MESAVPRVDPITSEPVAKQSSPSIFRWMSTHNPFYLISALLVLWGIRQSVLPEQPIDHVLTLWSITVLYILLLAIVTVLVIRLLQVWDDARTLLLLVPILSTTLSMLFDEFLIHSTHIGCLLLGVSYLLTITLFEFVLRASGIRLTVAIKGVFYLLLSTLYLYPPVMLWLSRQAGGGAWAVQGLSLFAPILSAEFLLLVFTISGCQKSLAQSGTPYPFPLFPYSLFALYWVLAMIRLYLLALAFGPGWNFVLLVPANFTPFVLVAGIIVLELSRATRSRWGEIFSLLTGPVVWVLGVASTTHLSRPEVLSPSLELIGWLCVVFYAWCVRRSVRLADWCLAASFLAVASSEPTLLASLQLPSFSPTLLAASYLGGRSIIKQNPLQLATSATLASHMLTSFASTNDPLDRILATAHIACCVLILIHVVARSPWMKDLHDVALIGLLAIFALTIITHAPAPGTHSKLVIAIYLLGMMVLVSMYGYLTRNSLATGVGWAMAGINLLVLSIEGLRILGQSFLRQSLFGLLIGLASLAIGLAVSFRKSERYSRQPISPVPDGPAIINESPIGHIPPDHPTVS